MTQCKMEWPWKTGLFASIVFLATVTAPDVQARPRDDVMANAYHCSVIAGSRQWLDCYYGAAQPARANLHMSPVPARQSELAAAPPAGGSPADLPVRDEVLADASRCYVAEDERQWLNCYYGAALPMRVRLGLAPASATRSISPPRDVKMGTARMSHYSFDRYGIFTMTLDDGRVWRQLDGDTSFAHWTKPAESYRVTITRGILGSYNLRVTGSGGAFKVEPAE